MAECPHTAQLASVKDRALRLDPTRTYIDRIEHWIDLRDEALSSGHRLTAASYSKHLGDELHHLDLALDAFILTLVSICEVRGIPAEPELSHYRRYQNRVRALTPDAVEPQRTPRVPREYGPY